MPVDDYADPIPGQSKKINPKETDLAARARRPFQEFAEADLPEDAPIGAGAFATDGTRGPRINRLFGAIKRWLHLTFGTIDVRRDFGAVGDGVTNDTAAIQAAIDAAAALARGCKVYFPPGIYLVTGLVVKNKRVRLLGAGGASTWNSSATFIRFAATKLYSTTNAPIIEFKEDDYTDVESQFSSMEDIAVEGLRTAGTSQVGIKVNNRGTNLRNVDVAGCGGIGIHIVDCVGSHFENVTSHHNNLQGWVLDETVGTAGATAAVATNTFVSCVSAGNDDQGWLIYGNTWGNVWVRAWNESNGSYGIQFSGAGAAFPRFNRWVGTWDESNTSACVRFDTSCTDNVVDFVRWSSPSPSFQTVYNRNLVTGSDILAVGVAQRRTEMLGHIRTWGGLSSTDIDVAAVRNQGDTDDGALRARRILLTRGTAHGSGDPTATGFQQGDDPVLIGNAQYLTWVNAAGNGRVQAMTVDSNNIPIFPNGVKVDVIATASLPAAGASQNGRVLIENAGAGDRNLIIYANGERFRLDGGTAF